MKAILEFNLPEETNEHYIAAHGGDYHSAVISVLDYIRSQLKHADISVPEEEKLESIRKIIHDRLDEVRVYF